MVAEAFFPLLIKRIMVAGDSGRFRIYEDALMNISIFGRGLTHSYAHNVFLEFLQDYGIVGLLLFLCCLAMSVILIWREYARTRDSEVLWVIGMMTLQLVGQRFSLNIYQSFFLGGHGPSLGLLLPQR